MQVVTPAAARSVEVRWLLRRYGLPMPPGPLRSVRPRSQLSFSTAAVLGRLTLALGGSDANAAELMCAAIERIDGPAPANGGVYCRHSWIAFLVPGESEDLQLCGHCMETRLKPPAVPSSTAPTR